MNLTPDELLAATMRADCWQPAYVTDLLTHMQAMRAEGYHAEQIG